MKNTVISFVFLLMFIAVSCGDSKGNSIKAGAACELEGTKSCSADKSQILVCSGSSWQTEKQCYLYLDQYCRQFENGDFSCTDSGNSSDPGNSGDSGDSGDSTDPNDNTTNDSDSTGTNDGENSETSDSSETADGGNAPDSDNSTEDSSESTDDDAETSGDSDSAGGSDGDTGDGTPEDIVQDLETCADIVKCRHECDSENCKKNCSKRGGTEAQNQFYENTKCPTYDYYTEIEALKDCQQIYLSCGLEGDASYQAPYGQAEIDGTFSYIHPSGTTSPIEGEVFSTGVFVTGTFGSDGKIPDDTANSTFSFAALYLDDDDNDYILLQQTYKPDESDKTPDVRILISAHDPGTHLVGIESSDLVYVEVKENSCLHAIGYGYVELSGTAVTEHYYSEGDLTLTIKGKIDLYSPKNAPMYYYKSENYNGDISAVKGPACAPK